MRTPLLVFIIAAACSAPPDVPCEYVPSLAGLLASVDVSEARAYIDRDELLAATDDVLARFGVVRAQDGTAVDIEIVWRANVETEGAERLATTWNPEIIAVNAGLPWSLDGCRDRVGWDYATALSHELAHVARLEHTATGLMAPFLDVCEVVEVCGLNR